MRNYTQIIERRLAELGSRVTVMGHHYQHDSVARHCSLMGDSLELARQVPGLTSDFIVFCGVNFMAETAAMLASDGQKVVEPAPDAGCVMSNMAPWMLLDNILNRLNADGPPRGAPDLREHVMPPSRPWWRDTGAASAPRPTQRP